MVPVSFQVSTHVEKFEQELNRHRLQEMFMPLTHPTGYAQGDFCEADVIITCVNLRAHYFCHGTSPQRCLLRFRLPGGGGGDGGLLWSLL